jgi:hypothetical protein
VRSTGELEHLSEVVGAIAVRLDQLLTPVQLVRESSSAGIEAEAAGARPSVTPTLGVRRGERSSPQG